MRSMSRTEASLENARREVSRLRSERDALLAELQQAQEEAEKWKQRAWSERREHFAVIRERQQLREALERITRWDYSECAVNNPVLIARAALAGEDTPGTQRERAVRDYRRRLVWSAFTHPHLVLYRAWIWCHAKSWRSLRWPLFYVIDPRPLDPVALRGLQRLTKEHLER